jgi:glycosyltransferase involved in cell wall biosynthesis
LAKPSSRTTDQLGTPPYSSDDNSATTLPSSSGRPLRILHIAKHCSYGNGNVHVAVDLACVQAQAGHEVIFASGGGTFVPLLERYGVRHVMMLQVLSKPVAMLRSAATLLRLCRATRPDILHAHMTAGAGLGYLADRLMRIPLVNTMHNSFDPQSIVMRLGDKVVAVSQAERTNLIKRGYKPRNVAVVLNAPSKTPRDTFMTNPDNITLERPCITMICALHRRKGVFDVINAFSTLAAAFPDWRLYIAGEGPDSEELRQQAATLGLADRVIFLSFVSDPKPLFAQLDIFVLASYADPGSLSIGEARAAGCAIIATAVGGTSEMLDYGAAGRLVSPGSPEQLAVQLRDLMQNPAARQSLREAAHAGSDSFEARHLVERYDTIYRELLAR